MSRMLNEKRLLECGEGCRPQRDEDAMTQKERIENHRELSGKRIVVLGGSSGIGLAVAQQVVARGARWPTTLCHTPIDGFHSAYGSCIIVMAAMRPEKL